MPRQSGNTTPRKAPSETKGTKREHSQKRISGEPLIAFKLRELLNMADLSLIVVLMIYTTIAVVFYSHVPKASANILLNAVIGLLILALAIGDRLHGGTIFRIARRYYPIPIIYLMYQQVHSYVPVVHPVLYDDVLIRWDQALFGVNPTQWLQQFAHPALTEYLQITYTVFYFLPVLHGVELTLKGDHERLNKFVYLMTFGFLVSYLLYFLMPAIGPRFTLHNFLATNEELPGLFLTSTFREFINAGGSAPAGIPDPASVVNRDCMPSGHTMMTLMNILLAFRYGSRWRWFFAVVGGSLIFSTIYLRYHYVVDVIAGVFCALTVLYLAPRLRLWVHSKGFIQA